jgi:hypothetical protein
MFFCMLSGELKYDFTGRRGEYAAALAQAPSSSLPSRITGAEVYLAITSGPPASYPDDEKDISDAAQTANAVNRILISILSCHLFFP